MRVAEDTHEGMNEVANREDTMWSKTIRVGLLTLTFLFTGCASDTGSDVEDAGTSMGVIGVAAGDGSGN